MDESWKADANCAGTGPTNADEDDVFFPGRGRGDLRKIAKEICSSCPVLNECDDYRKVTGSKHGIWAGKAS